MPLIKPVLEAQIFAALQKLFNNTSDTPIVAQQKLAKDLASAIDGYIKSATIIIPPGQAIQGINAPGQVIAGAGGGPAPVVGATTSPGTVAGSTAAPSPPATIS
jgi:hypothetical protein